MSSIYIFHVNIFNQKQNTNLIINYSYLYQKDEKISHNVRKFVFISSTLKNSFFAKKKKSNLIGIIVICIGKLKNCFIFRKFALFMSVNNVLPQTKA